ncbi:MAG: CHASE4 domain-containing protein, partial [Chloroflexota bacterium]
MMLRRKTIFIIGTTLFGLLLILYLIARLILMDSFVSLEQDQVRQDVDRTLKAIETDLTNLNATAGDWAHWDDTLAFVKGTNDSYVTANLTDEAFVNLNLNFMLFSDTAGQTVFGKWVDLQSEAEVPFPNSLRREATPSSILLQYSALDSSASGIVLLPECPLLVASQSILTSSGEGPVGGALMIGRCLDAP